MSSCTISLVYSGSLASTSYDYDSGDDNTTITTNNKGGGKKHKYYVVPNMQNI